jgi:hypothetical protein
MSRRIREDFRGSFFVSAGWLFADMLLVLAMLFLASSTISSPRASVTRTPTVKVGTSVTPKPTVKPPVDLLHKQLIVIHNVNYAALVIDNPLKNDIADLATQIKNQVIQQHLQNHRAGLAIAYGVAADNSNDQIDKASSISAEVYNALDVLRGQGFLFFRDTLPYEPLFTLNHTSDCNDLSCVKIVVFLFTQ